MTDYTQLCRHYFAAFTNRSVASLGAMFSPNITLRDWETEARGKAAVLEAIRKSFASVTSLQIEVLCQISQERLVASELKIIVNDTDQILVLDLIEFDTTDLISSIHAYKG